jgi:hypothetical protein
MDAMCPDRAQGAENKDFTARCVAPAASLPPRGGRRIEGFGPKLKRRIGLFSHVSLAR